MEQRIEEDREVNRMDWKESEPQDLSKEEIPGGAPEETTAPVVSEPEKEKTGSDQDQKKPLIFAGIGLLVVLAVIAAIFIIKGFQKEPAPVVCRHYGTVPEDSVNHIVRTDEPELKYGISRVVYSTKDPNWALVGIDQKGIETYKAYVHKEKCSICKGTFWVVKAWGLIGKVEKPAKAPADLP